MSRYTTKEYVFIVNNDQIIAYPKRKRTLSRSQVIGLVGSAVITLLIITAFVAIAQGWIR